MSRVATFARAHRALCLIFLGALLLRLLVFVADPNPYAQSGLSARHGEVARNIVTSGEWFVRNTSEEMPYVLGMQAEKRGVIDPQDLDYSAADAAPEYEPEIIEPPGAAIALAAAWALTGDMDYGWVQVVTLLLDAAMVFGVWWLSMQFFGRPRAALIAAGLYAVFPTIAFWSTIPGLDAWAGIFCVALAVLAVKARQSLPGWRWLLGLGLVAGVAMHFRPGLILVPAAMFLAMAPTLDWRSVARLVLIPSLVAALVIVPYTVRNFAEFDQLIPVRSGSGFALYQGLGEIENPDGIEATDSFVIAAVERIDPDLEPFSPEADEVLRGEAWEVIRENPGFFLRLLAVRVARSTIDWHGHEWPNTGLFGPVEDLDTNVPWRISRILEPSLVVFVLLTIFLTRALWRRHLVLIAIPVAVALPYVLLHIEARYLVAGTFAYLIIAGLGLELFAQRVRRGSMLEEADPPATFAAPHRPSSAA